MIVLVVEDEKDVRDLMLLHLKREGLDAESTDNGEEALRMLGTRAYDLVVLDWMLPGVSGLEVCKNVRMKGANPPVLMVTARADTSDIVLGLEMGADDYVTKPFEIPVFVARVRALMRRAKGAQNEMKPGSRRYEVGGLVLDVETHDVSCAGTKIELTPYEFKLLAALMENQGRVLSRQKLIDLVQGPGVAVVDRAIDTHVFGLRKKLGECSEAIETIRGVGYRVKAGV